MAKRLDILRFMVVETANFLNRVGEEYWMDFGTLLGYYREEGIIPHDVDVDFSLMESSFERVWSQRNQLPKEFKIYNTSQKHLGPKLYLSYKGFDVDLYFYEDIGTSVRSFEVTKWANEIQEIPKSILLPFRKVTFLETKVTVPADVRSYLEYLYGYIGSDAVRDKTTGFWRKR